MTKEHDDGVLLSSDQPLMMHKDEAAASRRVAQAQQRVRWPVVVYPRVKTPEFTLQSTRSASIHRGDASIHQDDASSKQSWCIQWTEHLHTAIIFFKTRNDQRIPRCRPANISIAPTSRTQRTTAIFSLCFSTGGRLL